MDRIFLEEKIVDLYKAGLSLKDVAIYFGYKSPNTIKNILIKHKISRRTKAGYKKPFNEEFFSIIDSEEKAYFLGFLMADGNVCEREKSQPCIRMELNKKDKYILEAFEELLGLENKVKDTRKNCVSIRFHSRKMFDDLGTYGVIPNKTKKESFEYIKILDTTMIRHFIRGFFDGDGWVTNTTSHGKRKGVRKCIGFVSNKTMLEEIREYLNSVIGTRLNKITERVGCSMLLYSSKRDIEEIKRYMYEDASIYLERKYLKCYEIYDNTETAISK
ncbi:MAG: LAGLIDADG family homing endonuclease [Sarcina sp.]